MNKFFAASFLGLLFVTISGGQATLVTTVNFSSGIGVTLTDNLGTALSGGTTADGDGDVLQLGYYSNATVGNYFSGTWVPLSGQGSANTGGSILHTASETFNQTSIGDANAVGAGNGSFSLQLSFISGDSGTGNNLPSSISIPLAIRFYNSGQIGTATFYNTVSDAGWVWLTPNSPPSVMNISLQDTNLQWQGGAASALKTTLAVPEPATTGIALLGGLAMLVRRRRNS